MKRYTFPAFYFVTAICAFVWFPGCEPLPESDTRVQEKDRGAEKNPATPAAKKPTAGDADVDEGERLYAEGAFEEALPHYEIALTKPLSKYSKSEVLTTIGNCYNRIENYDKSLEYHDRALAEDPDNHIVYVNKGVTLRRMGEFDRAKETYMKALALNPDYAELYVSLGALAVHQEDYDAAIKHLERAIELDASQPVAYSNLAVAYAYLGRFDKAEEQLENAVKHGYKQPGLIRQRIDELKASDQNPSE